MREIQKWNSNLIFALKLSLLISSIDHNDKIICFTGRLLDPALTATLNLHQYLLNASQHASAIYAAGLGMVRPFLPFLKKNFRVVQGKERGQNPPVEFLGLLWGIGQEYTWV